MFLKIEAVIKAKLKHRCNNGMVYGVIHIFLIIVGSLDNVFAEISVVGNG
jgi:hypothetical protein